MIVLAVFRLTIAAVVLLNSQCSTGNVISVVALY